MCKVFNSDPWECQATFCQIFLICLLFFVFYSPFCCMNLNNEALHFIPSATTGLTSVFIIMVWFVGLTDGNSSKIMLHLTQNNNNLIKFEELQNQSWNHTLTPSRNCKICPKVTAPLIEQLLAPCHCPSSSARDHSVLSHCRCSSAGQ